MTCGSAMSGDTPCNEGKSGEPSEEASEPRESIGTEEQVHRIREEFRW